MLLPLFEGNPSATVIIKSNRLLLYVVLLIVDEMKLHGYLNSSGRVNSSFIFLGQSDWIKPLRRSVKDEVSTNIPITIANTCIFLLI